MAALQVSQAVTNLTLQASTFTISGNYLTISNGFTTRTYGDVQLRYADLLAVELVTRRSKRLFYAMLIVGGVFMLIERLADFLPPAFLAIPIIIVCAIGAAYLFSARQYIEITSMKGTYLIPVLPNDKEMPAIVTALQQRIS
jgi:hypothetical protein